MICLSKNTRTLERFKNLEESFNKTHNNYYLYDKAIFKGMAKKITITCPIHGDFEQVPSSHLNGCKCQKCANSIINNKIKRFTTEEFIKEANSIHNNKYDYSKTIYITRDTKTTITCPIHGDFEQTPVGHLKSKYGCSECANKLRLKYQLKTTEQFIDESNIKHNNKYDYSKVKYITGKIPVIITCPIHGDFKQKPVEHINGCGCQICGELTKRQKYISKPTNLYYIKIQKGDKALFKIGITTHKNILHRYRSEIFDGYNIKILFVELFKTGRKAWLKEQLIINSLEEYLYKGDKFLIGGGDSELFIEDCLKF